MKRTRIISFLMILCMLITIFPATAPASQAAEKSYDRIYGATRYETAFQTADLLKQTLGVARFSNIIVACGTNFADALGGSYLAVVKEAPILLVQSGNMEKVKSYIKQNLKSGGTVYLLGGVNAVPKEMESGLDGFTVKRLGGQDRYETNLLILKEAGVTKQDIIVCTGSNYADSLSASALGLPILLVKGSITADQKAFLKPTSGDKIIIGGYSAVSKAIEKVLDNKGYGTGDVFRIGGSTRYQTSVMVALWFFETPGDAVIAYGRNFPDGLCAGPYAYLKKCPLILSANGQETPARAYMKQQGVQRLLVWGGPSLISNNSAKLLISNFSYASGNTTLPDFTTFMKQEPSKTNNKFRGGIKIEYHDLPESMEKTVIKELLALLQEDRYQLELVGSWTEEDIADSGAGFVYTYYNFLYVGNGSGIDLLSQKVNYEEMYNLQFKIGTPVGSYNQNHDSDIFIHYGKGFTLTDPGKRLSVTLPGEDPDTGGDDDGENTCSRCGGDGDCTDCDGKGYEYKWVPGTEHDYVKQTCKSCLGSGDCSWCGGDGRK